MIISLGGNGCVNLAHQHIHAADNRNHVHLIRSVIMFHIGESAPNSGKGQSAKTDPTTNEAFPLALLSSALVSLGTRPPFSVTSTFSIWVGHNENMHWLLDIFWSAEQTQIAQQITLLFPEINISSALSSSTSLGKLSCSLRPAKIKKTPSISEDYGSFCLQNCKVLELQIWSQSWHRLVSSDLRLFCKSGPKR